MGGGLMQLVAYGAQDIYLTGNPQITFFKVVYRRHTNFSMEAIVQTWDGSDGVSSSTPSAGRCTATISRNGDLIHRMYIEIEGTLIDTVKDFNAQSITDVELEIGGQRIDKHTGHWMNTWSHLTEPNPTGFVGRFGVNNGTTKTGSLFQNMSGMGGVTSKTGANNITYVPLMFWFCRNPGLSLPLISLQYHEVKVTLNHNFSNGYSAVDRNQLWADYIYLDTDERRRFAQVSHEYLIEQVQEGTLDVASTNQLTFNHPVKELIWTAGSASNTLTTPIGSIKGTFQLKLNGHDRFAARDWRYFTRTQIWQHHSGAGGLKKLASGGDAGSGQFSDGIGVYSFALQPEEHQPSGTCNFSRIDNSQFVQTTGSVATKIFAVNYNVLRIMSGMGGLAYSN